MSAFRRAIFASAVVHLGAIVALARCGGTDPRPQPIELQLVELPGGGSAADAGQVGGGPGLGSDEAATGSGSASTDEAGAGSRQPREVASTGAGPSPVPAVQPPSTRPAPVAEPAPPHAAPAEEGDPRARIDEGAVATTPPGTPAPPKSDGSTDQELVAHEPQPAHRTEPTTPSLDDAQDERAAPPAAAASPAPAHEEIAAANGDEADGEAADRLSGERGRPAEPAPTGNTGGGGPDTLASADGASSGGSGGPGTGRGTGLGPGAGNGPDEGPDDGTGNGSGTGPGDGTSAGIAALRSQLAWQTQSCYPAAARRRGTEGSVEIRFCTDAAGMPTDLDLRRSSGSALLDEAAVDCVVRGSAPFDLRERCITVPIGFRIR